MKNIFYITFLTGIFFILNIIPAVVVKAASEEYEAEKEAAQEMQDDEETAARDMDTYAEGEVVSVDLDYQTVNLDETNGGSNIYHIRKDTTFTTARSLSDINIGDTIHIDYYIFEEKRIAENIVVEKRVLKETESEPFSEDLKMLISD